MRTPTGWGRRHGYAVPDPQALRAMLQPVAPGRPARSAAVMRRGHANTNLRFDLEDGSGPLLLRLYTRPGLPDGERISAPMQAELADRV